MNIFRNVLACMLTITVMHANAQGNNVAKTNAVLIQDAWARATNPGQKVGAVYMTLKSPQDVTLIKIESDISDSVEIHSMSMQNGIMKMRMLEKLSLTANRPYKLASGGYHLMLFDLKKSLIAGEQINLLLHFTDKNNIAFQQKSKVLVKSDENTDHASDHEHHH